MNNICQYATVIVRICWRTSNALLQDLSMLCCVTVRQYLLQGSGALKGLVFLLLVLHRALSEKYCSCCLVLPGRNVEITYRMFSLYT